MSRHIALVIEALDECRLTHSNEYYVRVTLGNEKIGTHAVAPERSSLVYNAHTKMPSAAADDPNLVVEIINSYDEIVGHRTVRDWRKHLHGEDKGVLTASIYPPDIQQSALTGLADGESSPMVNPAIDNIGILRLRVYLNPNFEEAQKKFNRLDIYVSKMSNLVMDELLDSPPHVLLRLGDTETGVDLTTQPKRGAEDDWIWEEVLPFHYNGEDDVYFSVRDGRTDNELGRSVLSLSQIAHTLTKEASRSANCSTKKAGYVPINDAIGATIGMLLIGAELWDSNTVHKATTNTDVLKFLETRIAFDEKLLAMLEEKQEKDPAAMGASRADHLFIEGKLADARNTLQEAYIIRDEGRQGLKTRRDIRRAHQDEIKKCDEAENHLEKAEARLYNICCDISRSLDKQVQQSYESAKGIVRRCEIEASSSPRRGGGGAVDYSPEITKYTSTLQTLVEESHEMKVRVYKAEQMDVLPRELAKHYEILGEVQNTIFDLQGLNGKIRDANEQLRQAQRLRQLKEQEELYKAPPPVVVQRTGLNCFACCAAADQHQEQLLEEITTVP